jgi:hypothetical protein
LGSLKRKSYSELLAGTFYFTQKMQRSLYSVLEQMFYSGLVVECGEPRTILVEFGFRVKITCIKICLLLHNLYNFQMSMSLQMSQSMSVTGGGAGSPHHPQQPPPPQQSIVSYGGSPVGAGGGNTGPPPPQQQQHPPPTSSSAATVSSTQQSVSQPPPPAPDFSLEFLEHLPTGDSSHFSAAAQELLNSLDSASTFNLDIL